MDCRITSGNDACRNLYRSSRSFNTTNKQTFSLPRGNAMTIRRCRDDERDDILSIVNAAAAAYRGVIPADRWHEPYMPGAELDRSAWCSGATRIAAASPALWDCKTCTT
jgi:hypothetical protein